MCTDAILEPWRPQKWDSVHTHSQISFSHFPTSWDAHEKYEQGRSEKWYCWFWCIMPAPRFAGRAGVPRSQITLLDCPNHQLLVGQKQEIHPCFTMKPRMQQKLFICWEGTVKPLILEFLHWYQEEVSCCWKGKETTHPPVLWSDIRQMQDKHWGRHPKPPGLGALGWYKMEDF